MAKQKPSDRSVHFFKPAVETLEDRCLLSSTYTLSSTGVLTAWTGGKGTPILGQVTSFAVDKAGDVLAHRSDHTLHERRDGTWHVFITNVPVWGLDLDDDRVIVGTSAGGVWQAAASSTDVNGQPQWSTLGLYPVAAADKSFWFLGSDSIDGFWNRAVYRFSHGQVGQMPGGAIDLAVVEGAIWAFASPRQIMRWNGSAWVERPSAFDGGSNPYFVGTAGTPDHAIYHWVSGQGVTKIRGLAAVAVGFPGDQLQALTSLNQVWRSDGAAWLRQTAVTLPGAGTFFVTAEGGQGDRAVLRWAGGRLLTTSLTGTTQSLWGTGLGLAEGALWAGDGYGQIYRWDGAGWVRKPSTLAADGGAWFLGTASTLSDHFIYRFANGILTRLPGAGIALTYDGTDLGMTTAQRGVFRWHGTSWVKQVVIQAPDGSKLTQIGQTLWRSPSGSAVGQWQKFLGGLRSFAINVPDSNVLAVTLEDAVYQAPLGSTAANGYGQWSLVGFSPVSAPDKSVWFMGTGDADGRGNRPLYRIHNNQLTRMPGAALGLEVVEGGLWSFTNLREVWRWNGLAWAKRSSAHDGNSNLYFLGTAGVSDHAVYRWISGQGIATLSGRGAMAVGFFGQPYVLTSLNQVWRWDGSQWLRQGAVTLAGAGTFFVAAEGGQGDHPVLRWAGGRLLTTSLTGTTQSQWATGVGLAEGALWAGDGYGQVSRWDGAGWVRKPSTLATDGRAWFLGTVKADLSGNRFLYRYGNGQLVSMPGKFVALCVGEDTVFAVNALKQPWRWNGSTWVKQSTITDAAGRMWFLGTTDADGFGDRAILLTYQGLLGTMPGVASKLTIAEGKIWGLRAASDQAMYWDQSEWVYVPSVVAPDGSLWFLGAGHADAQGNHFIYRWSGAKLAKMPGSATAVVKVGSDLWTVNAGGQVCLWNGSVWVQKGNGMTAVARGVDGAPNAVNISGQVVRFDGTSWAVIAERALRASDGGAWFLGNADTEWLGNRAVLVLRNGGVSGLGYATNLGVAEGAIWISNADNEVFRWNQGFWIGFNSTHRLVAPDGSIWFLADGEGLGFGEHEIIRISNGQFTKMPGSATRLVGVAEGTVWALNSANQILRWNGTAWSVQPSAVFSDNLDGGVWCLGATDADGYGGHLIYRVANGQLTLMPGTAVTLLSLVSNRVLLAVNGASNQAMRWSGGWVHVASVLASDGNLFFQGSGSGSSNPIFRWKNGRLQLTLNAAVGLASVEGAAWAVDAAKKVWRWNGSIWSPQTAIATPDGAIWFLGTNANGQGNRSIYHWSDGQATAMPGAATGIWGASGTIWSIDAANQLWKWHNGAWTAQAALEPSSDGSFSLTGDDELAIKLVDYIAAKGSLGSQVGTAMPYIQKLQKVAVYGPDAKLSQDIMKNYALEGDAKLKAAIKATIDSQYAAHADIADHFGNGKWGQTKTRSIWDGFNKDGTGHYRLQELNSGYWQRGGVDKPVIEKAEVLFRSFDPVRKAWVYHVAVTLDTRVWIEAKEWSWGAELFHASLAGHLKTSVAFDLAIKVEQSFSLATMHLSAKFQAEVSNLDVSMVLDFGTSTPGNWLANVLVAPRVNLILKAGWAYMMAASTVDKSIDYFHAFTLDAGFVSGPGSKVKVDLFYNDVLKIRQYI